MSGTKLNVSAGHFPGKTLDYTVDEGTTVEGLLKHAGLDASGREVRLNGSPVDVTQVLADGDLVAIYQNMEGNEPKTAAASTTDGATPVTEAATTPDAQPTPSAEATPAT